MYLHISKLSMMALLKIPNKCKTLPTLRGRLLTHTPGAALAPKEGARRVHDVSLGPLHLAQLGVDVVHPILAGPVQIALVSAEL